MAGRSKAWDCCRSIGGIAGSNPTEGLDVRLLCLLCVVWVAFCATDGRLVHWESNRVSVCFCVCSRNFHN